MPKHTKEEKLRWIKPILDRADALGIDVGIECEPGLFLEYAAELREWIDRLNHPRFGANLDIGHSQVMGESIPDVVRLLAGRIWNLQNRFRAVQNRAVRHFYHELRHHRVEASHRG